MKKKLLAAGSFLILLSCSSFPPRDLNIGSNSITDCPSAPHCVSSKSTSPESRISPLIFKGSVEDFQTKLKIALSKMPRSEIIRIEGPYAHVEFTSLIMRFTDDLEVFFIPKESLVHVRSSSRIGYADFGVNHDRVETLRKLLSP